MLFKYNVDCVFYTAGTFFLRFLVNLEDFGSIFGELGENPVSILYPSQKSQNSQNSQKSQKMSRKVPKIHKNPKTTPQLPSQSQTLEFSGGRWVVETGSLVDTFYCSLIFEIFWRMIIKCDNAPCSPPTSLPHMCFVSQIASFLTQYDVTNLGPHFPNLSNIPNFLNFPHSKYAI